MTRRIALVSHSDGTTRRLISRGLNIFEPTHQVVTTETLSSASEWIESTEPTLVFLMGDHEHLEASIAWMQQHGIEPSRVILVGTSNSGPKTEEITSIPEPIGLAAVISAVQGSIDHAPTEARRPFITLQEHRARAEGIPNSR